ncbi:hypothetical protein [Bacillus weihaiensis]|uniref:hypothetical protein n=1 Tax=Bacillus weihaiensis TaxID=1547283 RepID=UPI002352A684|nr:hypothetical protein [Bacillus weihaiensis]
MMKIRLKDGFLLMLILSLGMLAACSNEDKSVKTSGEQVESPQINEDKNDTIDGDTEMDSSKDNMDLMSTEEMKKVGSAEHGYVYVPQDWINFIDYDGNSSFQVSNITKTQIISLNTFQSLGNDIPLENYADIVVQNMDGNGGQNIKGAIVKIKDIDALQVYASYDNGAYFVVAWIFESADGKVRYISAEGTEIEINKVVGLVENGGWTSD